MSLNARKKSAVFTVLIFTKLINGYQAFYANHIHPISPMRYVGYKLVYAIVIRCREF
jgi:hypothetical protein